MNGEGFTANPENLMDKGNRIIKLFERYEELLRNAKKVGDEITSIWNGSDATSYNASLKGYDDTFKAAGEAVNEIGAIINGQGNRLANSRDNIQRLATRL